MAAKAKKTKKPSEVAQKRPGRAAEASRIALARARAPGLMPPARGGQPTLFTPERRARILQALSRGAYRLQAAQFGGVGQRTLGEWLQRARTDLALGVESEYSDFLSQVEDAESSAVMKHLKTIADASPKNWTAAAWLLERRYPELYGRRTMDVNVSPRDARRLLADMLGLSEDQIPDAEAEELPRLNGTHR